jgi:hypothetical protein
MLISKNKAIKKRRYRKEIKNVEKKNHNLKSNNFYAETKLHKFISSYNAS